MDDSKFKTDVLLDMIELLENKLDIANGQIKHLQEKVKDIEERRTETRPRRL